MKNKFLPLLLIPLFLLSSCGEKNDGVLRYNPDKIAMMTVFSFSMFPSYLVGERYRFDPLKEVDEIKRYAVIAYSSQLKDIHPDFTLDVNCSKIIDYKEKCAKHSEILSIKRVIGLPGESIKIKNNTIYINNKKMKLTNINSKIDKSLKDTGIFSLRDKNLKGGYNYFTETFKGVSHKLAVTDYYFKEIDKSWKLKEGEYFLVGDNRTFSKDSRNLGPISIDQIRFIDLKTQ